MPSSWLHVCFIADGSFLYTAGTAMSLVPEAVSARCGVLIISALFEARADVWRSFQDSFSLDKAALSVAGAAQWM